MQRSPVTVGVAIMADPRRAKFVEGLLAKLDRPAAVVWDDNNDRWSTGRRSWLAYRDHEPVTHWLVVQDDAVICRDLVATVEQIATHHPDQPVGLYVGQSRPREPQIIVRLQHAVDQGARYFEMEGPWWGVAIAAPVEHIEPMIAWGDSRPSIANYDVRLSRYFRSRQIECLYPVPSLVDHRQDTTSLIPGRIQKGRKAYTFIGEHVSGLTYDWSMPPVAAPEAGSIAICRGSRTVYACWWCSMTHPSPRTLEIHMRKHRLAVKR